MAEQKRLGTCIAAWAQEVDAALFSVPERREGRPALRLTFGTGKAAASFLANRLPPCIGDDEGGTEDV